MANDDVWTLASFRFPDHWWDRHLIRTERGDVLPIGSHYPDGNRSYGPIVTGEFDLSPDIEVRKDQVRRIISENLQPRVVVDPDHIPSDDVAAAIAQGVAGELPPAPLSPVVTPADEVPPNAPHAPETPMEDETDKVKGLLKKLEESVDAAKVAKAEAKAEKKK